MASHKKEKKGRSSPILKDESSDMNINLGYGDADIQVLEGLEPVRKRPGMYIGSTGIEGLHHLIWEVLDNAVDEAVAGFAKNIFLTLERDRIVSVEDDGRGLPTGINPQTGDPTIITIFTRLHAGGKFDNTSYKVSGGLHGVGVKCVNALSNFFEVTTTRNGETYYAKFMHGGKEYTGPELVRKDEKIPSGTKVRWQPDFTILEDNQYDISLIKERLERLAYLNKQITFVFENKLSGEKKIFRSEGGLSDWVEQLGVGLEAIYPTQSFLLDRQTIEKKGKKNILELEVAFQYISNKSSSTIFSFCNNVYTPLGGSHLESVKEGLLSCVREISFHEIKKIKNIYELTKEDIISGLNMVLSLRYTEPSYKGQTKESLVNNEIRSVIKGEIDQKLHFFFEEHPDGKEAFLTHIERARQNRLQREAISDLEREIQRDNSLEFAEKLADCTIKNPDFSELYIVEGDSAGGSAKSARNREFQAILPIKGKLINVAKLSSWAKASKNQEICNLITAIGCSHSTNFDIEKLKYNKIVLMTDADVDGSHIRILILTFLYKYMTPLIENGKIFVAQPPLYKASSKKESIYLWSEEDKREFEKKRGKFSGFEISRFKGLGEMSPAQLWETTMDPQRRTFLQVKIVDPEKSDKTIEDLMGKEVKPRKIFIRDNYFIANLDI
ncbi:DNA gyrase/topoisomerase IV subunit B [Candidatus Mycoplasma haematominutum]|uniref:DNA topoisomerase (ATP-hydrolyzing) n=1 Tax=Candidatus Mycoplasma haematominutum 'Birmingham 1' TaxID=1116213 RepID=G8C2J1_9MOLU|nr:type IIA DNA topoisomerase subunit B [Candidatus Mycoplasma haematominutum]CCE66539.1 DNA gyrase subunit B [Candidatus Mycoplasma haematominutum 'Birmingham 1']